MDIGIAITASAASREEAAQIAARRSTFPTCRPAKKLGIKEVDEGIWLVSFMHYDLGYFDLEQKTLQPLGNPFGTRPSPMSQVRSVTHVSGLD
jgi:hypothetical protein